ncbi:MAG: SPOR domain-containing protein [Bacteroidales bacterium]|nr:SPOR domain-containing protein [Bacteroidales bacterium]
MLKSKLGGGMKYLFLSVILLLSATLSAQNEEDYDEITVYLAVQKVGTIEISAVIMNEQAYLPVTELFDFLKIKNQISSNLDSITGFFISPKAQFLIDYNANMITLQDVTTNLPAGAFVRTETNLYLHTRYFGQVFGLNCFFNFRSLGVILDTKLELPIIREMHQEEMRKNINKLKGEVNADTVLPRSYPWFHFGNADWSIITSQLINGRNDTRLNLGLGGVIAGGEANVSLLYNNHQPFKEKQQQYLWRYANNDHRMVRQVLAGKIPSQATSSIYAPVVGVQITNTPTTFRRSFGTYSLSDKTEPGWTVELYVNNVLVDYTKADASGFFTFEVPLVYGNSAVLLKFFGPWGEERIKEQNISIPFSFLPPGEFQYTAGAGIVEDSLSSRYSKISMNFGLTRRMTIGAGTEYLSSVKSGTVMPYLNTSLRLASSLLLNGEYIYGVRTKGLLTYRLPSNLQFELYLAKYDRNQKAINYNYLQERKAIVSIPFRARSISAFTRLTLSQIILPESDYTTAEFMLSGAIMGVSTNITTYAMFIDPAHPYAYSNLSLSFRLPASFVLIPQVQYEYNNNKLISLKFGLEKHVFRHGFVNVSYEKNYRSKLQNLEFGFKYDLAFAQTAFTARRVNSNVMLTQSARGTIMMDRKTDYLHAGNRSSMGKGAITIIPFLDLNCNEKQDAGEPRVIGLNLHTNGGRMEFNKKDSTIIIFDLEPYSSQIIEFDKNSFDNIAWQLRKPIVKVSVDPNQFRRLEVPISVYGEASGMIYLNGPRSQKGQSRIIINFLNENGNIIGRTLSESDGYFSFLGLPPGKYIAKVDSVQMSKVKMNSSPGMIPFEILSDQDGDIIDDLEFILESTAQETKVVINSVKEEDPKPLQADTENTTRPAQKSEPAANTKTEKGVSETSLKVEEKKFSDTNNFTLKTGDIVIQMGAFKSSESAEKMKGRLVEALNKEVVIRNEAGFYRVYVVGFSSRQEANSFLPVINNRGFKDFYIIKIK